MRKGRLRRLAALALAALLACSALALAGCSGSGGDGGSSGGKGTLKVGVRSDIMGFSSYNEETGKYHGLEIDIANEMAERLGYDEVEFTTVTPDNRKERLMNSEIDCIIACYSISDTRLANFDFSPEYYTDYARIMVENTSLIDSVDDLKGMTIGTLKGVNTAPLLNIELANRGFTSGEPLVQNEDNTDVQYDNYHMLQFDSYQELSDALEEGTIDALAADGVIVNAYMNDERSVIEDFTIEPQRFGVATQKDSALSAPVAEAIQGMLDDGTIAALIDKWN